MQCKICILQYKIIQYNQGDVMGIEKKTYSMRLDESLAEKIRAYAAAENRNLSNMVETILLQYVAKREQEESGSK